MNTPSTPSQQTHQQRRSLHRGGAELADMDRHERLAKRALDLLGQLIGQHAAKGATGTIGIEIDLRGGLAHVVRQRTATTEI